MNNKEQAPLVMAQEYWMNTHLSVARFSGCVRVFGHEYYVVDKNGRDLYECTKIANMEGRTKAIEAGEPADLCRKDFMKTYRKLGRDKVLELLKDGKSKKEIDEYAKSVVAEKTKVPKAEQMNLF